MEYAGWQHMAWGHFRGRARGACHDNACNHRQTRKPMGTAVCMMDSCMCPQHAGMHALAWGGHAGKRMCP